MAHDGSVGHEESVFVLVSVDGVVLKVIAGVYFDLRWDDLLLLFRLGEDDDSA